MHGMVVDFHASCKYFMEMAKTTAIFRIYIRKKIVHKLRVRCDVYLPILMLVLFSFWCGLSLNRIYVGVALHILFTLRPWKKMDFVHILHRTILRFVNDIIASADFCINYFK